MALHLQNTLSRSREPFEPLEAGKVKMYVCGPTVYNYIHVGNARPLVFFDVVRRYLELQGYEVTFILNYTDVDDKIIERAATEKVPWTEITRKYIEAYEADMRALGVKPPTKMPRVSETIPQIIRITEGLVKNGSAYVEDGEVFFSVRHFAPYGKLSGKKVDDLMAGARVEVGLKKKDPLDFTLWKPRKTPDEPAWESPWGLGRPGWHIECSAMSMEFLGETFDIHGGGMDLIHPHHENEIAQSEALTKKPLCRYWLHNNMLSVDNEKMSKSIGNIFLTRDFVRQFMAETLKFLLLSGHYRSTIDFSERNIRDAQTALHRYYKTVKRAEALLAQPVKANPNVSTEENKLKAQGDAFETTWREMMDDDLNTARVFGAVFEYVRALNAAVDRKGMVWTPSLKAVTEQFLANMQKLGSVLNLFSQPQAEFLSELRTTLIAQKGLDAGQIEAQIQARIDARKNKDFAAADRIRDELIAQGVELRDNPTGTEWDVVP